jgi:hypothetical protein
MKTIVRYDFDNGSFFPRDFNGSRSVKFIDPAVIPSTGDKVHIRMEEFFDDADLLGNFNDQSEGQVYYAERINTIIGKNETEVIIVLFEEAVFKQLFPYFFSGALINP